jgi:hypothetical protein
VPDTRSSFDLSGNFVDLSVQLFDLSENILDLSVQPLDLSENPCDLSEPFSHSAYSK